MSYPDHEHATTVCRALAAQCLSQLSGPAFKGRPSRLPTASTHPLQGFRWTSTDYSVEPSDWNWKCDIMAGKPKLIYFKGRGRMESVRWLLAAAGVEFEEEFLEKREQYEKLLQDGVLLFDQVPLVEIDGLKIMQTRAILNYIAAKYNLYGRDLKERAMIDMYVDGTGDLMALIIMYFFLPPDDQQRSLDFIIQRATKKYFPAYEKVLQKHGQQFLVGNRLSWADAHLLESILMVEEINGSVLSSFPELQAFKARISSIPTIAKFLEPGSQRKPPPDANYVQTVKAILQI